MNRGRIQAQGNKTQKSSPWALLRDHTKSMGIERVENLSGQLSPSEFKLRAFALQAVRKRIFTAPPYGISADHKKSYWDNFRKRHIRIDIEVNSGIAFIDDPTERVAEDG